MLPSFLPPPSLAIKLIRLFILLSVMPTIHADRENIKSSLYGKMPDGRDVHLFTLCNKHHMEAKVTNYGATLVSVSVPDRSGKITDVTQGFDDFSGWLENKPYFGASIGRYGNRIRDGKFVLDGKTHSLATNNAPAGIPCHLHGGKIGFDKVLWSARPVCRTAAVGVEFTYLSPHSEEGYPGNLTTQITYWLNDQNELVWEAAATTDQPTFVNLMLHTYWNLSDDPASSIANHELTLHAGRFVPTAQSMIPTGELLPVAGTPMDFTHPRLIGAQLDESYEAIAHGSGYDHCYVLSPAKNIRSAAKLKDPASGRVMEILTDQPGVQFYSSNFLDGTVIGKKGVKYPRRSAVCLETGNFPDAPNQPHFPSALLRPDETYTHTLIHRFSVE